MVWDDFLLVWGGFLTGVFFLLEWFFSWCGAGVAFLLVRGGFLIVDP